MLLYFHKSNTKATMTTKATMVCVCNGCGCDMPKSANHCDKCKVKLFPKSSAVQSTIAKVPRPPKSCHKGVLCRLKECNRVHECRYGVNCRCLQPGSTSRCKFYHDRVDAHEALFGSSATAHMLKRGHL